MTYKLTILLSCFLSITSATTCDFKSLSYCGSSYIGITDINITGLGDDFFDVSAKVFSKDYDCNKEKFECFSNGNITFPDEQSDCLVKMFSQYNIDPTLKYSNSSNVINIEDDGFNIELKPC